MVIFHALVSTERVLEWGHELVLHFTQLAYAPNIFLCCLQLRHPRCRLRVPGATGGYR